MLRNGVVLARTGHVVTYRAAEEWIALTAEVITGQRHRSIVVR
jgi:hypothetical protein